MSSWIDKIVSKNIGGVDLDSVYDEMGFAVNYCNHSNF